MTSSRPPVAWVLNLDAENELEGGRRYAPTRHLQELVRTQSKRLAGTLVLPGDVVVTAESLASGDERARGLPGVAWSPTPRAHDLLARAGARALAAPDVEVLQRVNERPFATRVRAPLAGTSFAKEVATSLAEVLALVARPRAEGWLVRRGFGAAGRGRRRLGSGAPTESEHAWLVASLRRGPLIVEPWVRILREYTRSGWVTPTGGVVIAAPGVQETSSTGAWIRTDAAGRSEVGEDDARLEEAAHRAGEALAAAGYFGPFGIDAFRHRDERGRDVLNPLSEINARFTMDWPTEKLAQGIVSLLEIAAPPASR